MSGGRWGVRLTCSGKTDSRSLLDVLHVVMQSKGHISVKADDLDSRSLGFPRPGLSSYVDSVGGLEKRFAERLLPEFHHCRPRHANLDRHTPQRHRYERMNDWNPKQVKQL